MKVHTNRFNLQSSHFWLKMGLALTIAVGMVSVVVFFVFAASVPVITAFPAGVEGGWVQVRIDNLPANTDFVVYEGKAGTQGMGGSRIAGFNTRNGGSQILKFELATGLYNEKTIDIRIDDGSGNVAYATIPNIFAPTPTVVRTTGGVANVPVTGATAAPLATQAAGVTGTPEATLAAGVTATVVPTTAAAASATPLATNAPAAGVTETVVPTTAAAASATPLATTAPAAGVTETVVPTTAAAATATVVPTTAPAVTATAVPTTTAGTTATPAAPVVVATPGAVAAPVIPVTGPDAGLQNLTFSNQIQLVRNDFGGLVTFLISNLSKNTDYRVLIGKAGTNGFGGYAVAGYDMGDRAETYANFEVPVLLRDSDRLDLRLEGNDGSLFAKTFSNVNFPNGNKIE